MSDRIGGNRPPPKAPDLPRAQTDETTEAKKAAPQTPAGAPAEEQSEVQVDHFERTVKAGAQTLAKNIGGLAAKSGIKDRFTSADLAYLASTFAAILLKKSWRRPCPASSSFCACDFGSQKEVGPQDVGQGARGHVRKHRRCARHDPGVWTIDRQRHRWCQQDEPEVSGWVSCRTKLR